MRFTQWAERSSFKFDPVEFILLEACRNDGDIFPGHFNFSVHSEALWQKSRASNHQALSCVLDKYFVLFNVDYIDIGIKA